MVVPFVLHVLANGDGGFSTCTFDSLGRGDACFIHKYVYEPKMAIDYYDISVEQKSETIRSVVGMEGTALAASEVFIFCLNPGLRVEEVKDGEKSLNFKRE